MIKKRGLPSVGELVRCRVTRINPNSAFAFIEEYGTEGMIHISEISRGWVRDIRKHIKTGQNVTAKVMRIDRIQGHISLSLKRVDQKQEKEKLKEYKLDQKAEKMLEIAAGEMKVSLDEASKNIGFLLQENFGSLYEGFKTALKKPDVLIEKGISEGWVKTLKDVAEKNIEQKEVEFKQKIVLRTYAPDGINVIKKILKEARNMDLKISYIAAPEYVVRYKTKDVKKGEREFKEKVEKILKTASTNGVENDAEKMQ